MFDALVIAGKALDGGFSMPSLRHLLCAALLAVALCRSGMAQDLRGDPESGRRLALATCQLCHQIDTKQAAPKDEAPSWPAIANMPSTTALSLAVFLQTNHRNMPNFVLTKSEIEDLIAYILSLKGT
jgi:mono/diheme cytochrome c family protein